MRQANKMVPSKCVNALLENIFFVTYGLFLCWSIAAAKEDVRYLLEEEKPSGTFIGNVVYDAKLTSRYGADVLRQLQFKFMTQPTIDISLEMETGALRTSGRIDREYLCPSLLVCDVTLDLVVQPMKYFQIIKVVIEIVDVNDNFPQFPQSLKVIDVSEAALIDGYFSLPPANDLDNPKFGVCRYEMVTWSSVFRLDEQTEKDGTRSIGLVLMEKLDREFVSQYLLQVTAYDCGDPPRSGVLDIQVNVVDVNDNSPRFENNSMEANLMENSPPQTIVFQLKAFDRDSGPNGEVVYFLRDQGVRGCVGMFEVNNMTGIVRVKGQLDYELVARCTLVAVAKDRGQNAQSSEITLFVNVIDENDNPPSITINTLTSPDTSSADVSEDAEIGTFVAHVLVRDKDGGRNGKVNCSLEERDAHFKLIQLYETEFQLVTSYTLDRESRAYYTLLITCRDNGIKQLVSNKRLVVNVSDVNDRTPSFTPPSYRVTFFERNYRGFAVVQVTANDADIGKNAAIHYELPAEVQNYFYIQPVTGQIEALVPFNREEMDRIEFYVKAIDQGNPARTGSALVSVIIEDLNDETPKFSQDTYSFNVKENLAPGIAIGALSATDKDAAPHNEFTFSFYPTQGIPIDAFKIDPKTGVISTAKTLDREERSQYQLVGLVSDNDMPDKSSTATIVITVEDENDNSPNFVFPSLSNNTIHISNSLPVGHVIAHVSALDRDAGKNAELTYSMRRNSKNSAAASAAARRSSSTGVGEDATLEDGDDDRFRISQSSGTISLARSLLDVRYDTYFLRLEVADGANPPRRTNASLVIVVNASLVYIPPVGPGFVRAAGSVFLSGLSFTMFLIIGCICGVLIIVFIVAIAVVIICRRNVVKQRRQKATETSKYNCRTTEAMRMLKDQQQPQQQTMNIYQTALLSEKESTKGFQKTGCIQRDGAVMTLPSNGRTRHKEVTFRCDDNPGAEESETFPLTQDLPLPPPPPSWTTSINKNTATLPSSRSRQTLQHPVGVLKTSPSTSDTPWVHRTWTPGQKSSESHHLLGVRFSDKVTSDDHSLDGSATDSGRGGSEEGDGKGAGCRSHVEEQLFIRQLPASPVRQHTPNRYCTLPTAAPAHHSFLPPSRSDITDIRNNLTFNNNNHESEAMSTPNNGTIMTSSFSRQHAIDTPTDDVALRSYGNGTVAFTVNSNGSPLNFSPARHGDVTV